MSTQPSLPADDVTTTIVELPPVAETSPDIQSAAGANIVPPSTLRSTAMPQPPVSGSATMPLQQPDLRSSTIVYPTQDEKQQYISPARQIDDLINGFLDRVYDKRTKDRTILDRPWEHNFCDCCSPTSDCLVTLFCPCVTFGRTWSREEEHGYDHDSAFNFPCLLSYISFCFGVCSIPPWILRSRMRKNHGLSGNFASDGVRSVLCTCCTLMQEEKESKAKTVRYDGSSGSSDSDGRDIVRQYSGNGSRMHYHRG